MVKRFCSVSKQDELTLSSRWYKQKEVLEAAHWRRIRLSMVKCSQIGVISMFVTDTLSMATTLDSTHNIIAGGMNPLYMSCFVAAYPLVVLERKRKHSLLSILSGNMLSNIQSKALDARYIRAVKDNPTNICLPKENTHTR